MKINKLMAKLLPTIPAEIAKQTDEGLFMISRFWLGKPLKIHCSEKSF